MTNKCLIIDMHSAGVDGAVGRVIGIQVKDRIISDYNSGSYERIVLDFTKVDFVTSGFAKELFGGLFEEYRATFKQLITVRIAKENEALKNTIIRAMATVIEQSNYKKHE